MCPNNDITQGSEHKQCYARDYSNDGTYNCVNRADEEYLRLLEDTENYSSVVPCNNATDFYNLTVPGRIITNNIDFLIAHCHQRSPTSGPPPPAVVR